MFRRQFIGTYARCSLALIAAEPAAALDTACHFTTECLEAEPCAEADFELEITSGDRDGAVVLSQDMGTAEGEMTLAENGAALIAARSPVNLQIVTVGADGESRYSLHFADGPLTVSYLGTCGDAQ